MKAIFLILLLLIFLVDAQQEIPIVKPMTEIIYPNNQENILLAQGICLSDLLDGLKCTVEDNIATIPVPFISGVSFENRGISKINSYSFAAYGYIYGSFSKSHSEEALSVLYDPVNDSGGVWLGLFRRDNDAWKLISPVAFHHSGETFWDELAICLAFTTKQDRDVMLCMTDLSNDADYGSGFYIDLYEIDLNEIRQKTFFRWRMRSPFCHENRNADTKIFKFSTAFDWVKQDINADGYEDLVVSYLEYEADVSQCSEENFYGAKINNEPPIQRQLVWLIDSESFTPTPETKAFLETLETQQ